MGIVKSVGTRARKCPAKGCYLGDGHDEGVHGTRAELAAKQRASRGRVTTSYRQLGAPRAFNPRPHDQFGRRVVSKRLRKAYAGLKIKYSSVDEGE